ncbi:MAG: pyridoxamine 5'-phosphate oxidase family protein [Erysipelotrichaceae bacterium]|nr:pyridoxamine 5'-phosphate oxidase family protein [Erysipelotrichaceae bacterium]
MINMLDRVKEMLMNNSLCVLCTVSKDLPYCSLMTYVLSDDLKTVYMVTYRNSRKFRNLLENSKVSLLVDNRHKLVYPTDETVASVTFEGVLKHLDPLETEIVRIQLVKRHDELKNILNTPDCVIFGIELKSFLLLNGPVDSVQGEF